MPVLSGAVPGAGPGAGADTVDAGKPAVPTTDPCTSKGALTVHFYDAGQALAALVDLPDGRRILVDTGESSHRPDCAACFGWHRHVMDGLRQDLGSGGIDMVWITHPHSDHVGGAEDVLETFPVGVLVDNGRDEEKQAVSASHRAAEKKGVAYQVVDLQHPRVPIPNSELVTLASVVPRQWHCSNANNCSIGLRIAYGRSSVLFVGDAERGEEPHLDVVPSTLLQVGHHGSNTSSTPRFLERVRPRYAVIPAAKPGEGTNQSYCHPRSITLKNLAQILGGPSGRRLEAFDGEARCDREPLAGEHWAQVPASDRLWVTGMDGDVILSSLGDGEFRRCRPGLGSSSGPSLPSLPTLP